MPTGSPEDRDQRFPPNRRILTKKQFQKIFREGRRYSRPSLVVYARRRPEEEDSWSRLGLAVSRKVGKAVVRNRTKRRLRDLFRRHQWEIKPPCDLVVIARPGAAFLETADLESEFLLAVKAAVSKKPGKASPRRSD